MRLDAASAAGCSVCGTARDDLDAYAALCDEALQLRSQLSEYALSCNGGLAAMAPGRVILVSVEPLRRGWRSRLRRRKQQAGPATDKSQAQAAPPRRVTETLPSAS